MSTEPSNDNNENQLYLPLEPVVSAYNQQQSGRILVMFTITVISLSVGLAIGYLTANKENTSHTNNLYPQYLQILSHHGTFKFRPIDKATQDALDACGWALPGVTNIGFIK